MTNRNDNAWEIVLEKLSRKERERLLKLAQQVGIDTSDPTWVMLLATSLTRQELLRARAEVSGDIDIALKNLNRELAKTRKAAVEIADVDFRRKSRAHQREIENAAQRAIREAVEREKPRRPWRSIATAAVAAVFLTAAAVGLGAVAGKRDAAASHARLADRYEGPYTDQQERLLSVVGGNLPRADSLMTRCRDRTFEPATGGRACKVTLWLQEPGGEALDRASPDWPQRIRQGFWSAVGSIPDPL